MQILFDSIKSPIGPILIAAAEGRLLALEFAAARPRFDADLKARFGAWVLKRRPNPFGFSDRIRAYLAGELTALDDIPVDGGGTSFQRRVWMALREIPAGATRTYSDIARAVGRPRAVRAVGMINGRNPISIVVPCHRVIGKDGSLTGYGGGLARKAWLLRHEGVVLPTPSR